MHLLAERDRDRAEQHHARDVVEEGGEDAREEREQEEDSRRVAAGDGGDAHGAPLEESREREEVHLWPNEAGAKSKQMIK